MTKKHIGSDVKRPKWVCSTKDVAQFFGVTTAAVRLWSKNGCPKIGSGRWDLRDVFMWWWDNIGQDKSASDDETIQDVKRKYWSAKAEHEELKVAILKGDHVKRDDVISEWVARVHTVKGDLKLLAKRLGPVLEGKTRTEIMSILNEEFGEIMRRYARGGKHTPTVDA